MIIGEKVHKRIILIVLASFLVQFYFLCFLQADCIKGDGHHYYQIGRNLLTKKGFYLNDVPNVRRPPFYPLVLAGLFYLFDYNMAAVQFVQVVLNILTCLLIYFLARRLFSERTALLSAVAAAVFPPLAVMSFYVLSEGLAAFLLTAAIFLLYAGLKVKRSFLFILLGIVLALGTLTRPTLLLFPAIVLFLLFVLAGWKQAVRLSLSFVLPFILLVGVWTARNYLITGKLIPVTIGADIELWNGSYLPAKGEMEHPLAYQRRAELNKKFDPQRPYYEWFKPFRYEAWKNVREHPWGYLALLPRKFVRLYVGSYSFNLNIKGSFKDVVKPGQWVYKLIMLASSLAILVFSLVGAVGERRKEVAWPFWGIFAYWTAIHLPFSPIQRFSLPLLPVMLIFAVEGCARTVNRFKLKRKVAAQV